MAKRNRGTTKKKIEKWTLEGRGQGVGEDYKPWLTIQDVPSEGITPRHKGWKTGRIHHLMSQLELHYLYELEWSRAVIDIKEQYPLLPLERTIEIAESLGIKHPNDPKTQEPIVMTTDFMISTKSSSNDQLFARQIKPTNKLNKREIEKFAIEQQFYKEQGIDWGIVTEKQRDEVFIKNIEWLYNARYLEYFPSLNIKTVERVAPTLLTSIRKSKDPLALIALECDSKFGFQDGSCLFIVKHMLANK
ncbi:MULTISPECIES: TnsA endonuclease N-terminal domain-containing protein [Clostridia]|uniref:TnsA endonuclease N-terminal domain-containing protein n=1 Tax=Clostridia TaxID=186801 RepID=UPI000EA25F8B|nr:MULTISPECIES: TnsA endonuclease N-terminal domain-containing protein [Clostridia]NBJ70583.1 heteromeric transposase endonuclease subunit TnsA [Roseburia sp. 1XD42-34]RKI76583.1 heteromeric transposase endonuclease subunit TnsA [Clostridium sp. 1xD42-85]